MAPPSELAGVMARGAMRLVDDHARMQRCRIAVFGADGISLAEGGEIVAAPRLDSDAPAGPAAAFPVVAYDRVLGFVVARGDAVAGGDDSARGVAAHGAALLSELCTREVELNDLSREILAGFEELNLFYELGGELAGARDADAACRVVLEKARRVIGATDGRVLLADGVGGALRTAATTAASDVARMVPLDEGRAGAVFESRVAETIDDVAGAAAAALPEFERAATSLVTAPLCVLSGADRSVLGVMQLRDKKDGAPFSSGDLKLAVAIAGQAAALIQNARLIGVERELRLARTIQERLLPEKPPVLRGFDVAGTCVQARGVGGDFYDFVESGEDALTFVVADVSGHDLGAALLQTEARAAFRTAASAEASPVDIVRRAGHALADDLSRAEMFLTAWLGRVDAATGRLSYCDAGHHPAIHVRAATRRAARLSTSGLPIGVGADAYDEKSVVLEPGDVVVAYTDGLVEAGAGGDVRRPYGEARLVDVVTACAERPAAEIVRAVLADVAAHAGERSAGDDRTLVVLRRVSSPSEAGDSQAESRRRSMRNDARASGRTPRRRRACRKPS